MIKNRKRIQGRILYGTSSNKNDRRLNDEHGQEKYYVPYMEFFKEKAFYKTLHDD